MQLSRSSSYPWAVLPACSRSDDEGHLWIGGCAIAEVIEELGTPAMLIDGEGLRSAAREYLGALRSRHSSTDVYFASKALPCPAVAGLFAEEGLGCDVASRGELALALAGGVPAKRILMHGNAKTDADIAAALEAEVGLIVVDSFDEIDRLARLVSRPQRLLLRVNPGVRAATREAVATGHAASKFGVPTNQVAHAISRIEAVDLLTLEGIHVHIGSQIFDLDSFAEAVSTVAQFGAFGTYDFGGGLGVRFLPEDAEGPSIDAYAERLVAAAREHLGGNFRLIVEPGRSLVARSVITAYRVVVVKRSGVRTFVAVDGGMGDNLLPRIDGTRFAPFVLDADRPLEVCDLVGPHCETGDRIGTDVSLATPSVGDVVVVPVTGAYTASLANNYNAMPRPPLAICAAGRTRVVTRRETVEDLLARHELQPAVRP